MAGWFTKKLRAGRYSMNLQVLEAGLRGTPADHWADAIVAAAAVVKRLQTDNFVVGTRLDRAVLEPGGCTQVEAEGFYDTLEDVLGVADAQLKGLRKAATARLGAEGALQLEKRAQVHSDGIRLLMVALARQADEAFKIKARVLREPLCGADEALGPAVTRLQAAEALMDPRHTPDDFDAIRTKASLFSMSALGW